MQVCICVAGTGRMAAGPAKFGVALWLHHPRMMLQSCGGPWPQAQKSSSFRQRFQP